METSVVNTGSDGALEERPPWRAALALAVAIALVAGVADLAAPGHSRFGHWWSNGFWILFSTLATIQCTRTAAMLRGAVRRAWTCFAAGCGAWLAGTLVFAWDELFLGRVSPFPSLADAGYLALPVLFVVGLLRLRAGVARNGTDLDHLARLGITVCSVAIAVLVMLFEPLRRTPHGSLYTATALAYPVLHVSAAVFSLYTLWAYRWGRRVSVLWLLFASLAVHAAANTTYALEVLQGQYRSGAAFDALWLVAFGFVWLAAAEQRRLGSRTEEEKNEADAGPARYRGADLRLPILCLGVLLTLAFARREHLDADLLTWILPPGLLLIVFLTVQEWSTQRMQAKLHEDRLRAERDRSASDERFRNLIEGSIQGILIQQDYRPVFSNQALADMLGFASPEEVTALKSLDECLPAYEQARIRALSDARFRRQDVPSQYELDVIRRDGATITLQNSVRYITWHGRPAIQSTFVEVTDRKRAEESLRRENAFIENAIDSLPGIFYLFDVNGRFLRWNRNFEQVSGYSGEEIAHMHPLEFFRGDDRPLIEKRIAEVFRDGESSADAEFVSRDGTATPSHFTGRRVVFDGAPCLVGMGIDLSDRVRAERALKLSEARYRALYDHNPSMFFTLDASGIIRSVNRFGAEQLGFDVPGLIGRSAAMLYPEEVRAEVEELLRRCCREPATVHRWEMPKTRSDGSTLWVRETARVMGNPDGRPDILIVSEDTSEARRLSEKLAWQASHDALTGLVNRHEFEQRLERVLRNARETPSEHALCYLDLDQFKIINDTCGHVAGDELLRQLARTIGRRVRRRDTLARLGGDEFGVLMDDCTLEHASRVAEGLRREIAEYVFVWEGRSFHVGVSIGVMPIDKGAGNVTQVLSGADAACYVAKEQGRNRVHVFRHDDAQLARRAGEMRWIERINHALREDGFELVRQPIVPLRRDTAEGDHFELLLRMRAGNGELLGPGPFLAAAERYGLASRLDRWVVNRALHWLAASPARLRGLHLCAINLSGNTLGDDGFLDFVVAGLEETGVPPQRICFEITETAAIANLTAAISFITALRERGCLFALDDFGSGLSSFAYLKSLPVDFLKIDGLFVKDIVDDPIELALVRSINDIAHVMGKRTVAEFVENEQVLELLTEIGVDYAQGYHLGEPEPIDASEPAEACPQTQET